jgi:hypothetical protein
MTLETDQFECPACHRRFRWKPEMARCPCGNKMRCPAQMPGDDGEYDLTPQTPKVAPRPIHAAAPVAVIPYRGPEKAVPSTARPSAHRSSPEDTEAIVNFTAPLWLLVGGIVVEIIAGFFLGQRTFEDALILIGLKLIGGTLLMLIGVWIAAAARGVKLGPLPTAMFKLAAISIAPSALGDLLLPFSRIIPSIGIGMIGIPLGPLLLGVAVFGFYFALLGMFFDLDESDTWYFVWVIFLVKIPIYLIALNWNL